MVEMLRVFFFHRDKHEKKIQSTFKLCNSVFMVLAILWLGQLGSLAVKSKFKDDKDGFKKDNRIHKAAIAFFIISLGLSLFFFHLGDHLNGLKRSKNKCALFYGLSTMFLGIIPLFVESAAIDNVYRLRV